jgi:hypothetical protein
MNIILSLLLGTLVGFLAKSHIARSRALLTKAEIREVHQRLNSL